MDKQNNILASTSHEMFFPESLTYLDLVDENTVMFHEVNGEKTAISFIQSDVTDWKYVSVIPSRIFWEKSEYLRKLSLLGIGLCLLLGLIISYLYSRINYNPISSIIETLTNKLNILYEKDSSEYLFIQQAIRKHWMSGKKRKNN